MKLTIRKFIFMGGLMVLKLLSKKAREIYCPLILIAIQVGQQEYGKMPNLF